MTELVYCYDGTFDGFLCCVFQRYACRETPTAIVSQEDLDLAPTLFPTRHIVTDSTQAGRVYRKVRKLSPDGAYLLRQGFLTCLPEREMHLCRLCVRLIEEGPGFLRDLSDEELFPVRKAVRFLGAEVEKLRGFVRFSDFGGILGGEIEPKNRVLPVLRSHFCTRYQNETFFLYDRTHHEVLLYDRGRAVIAPLAHFEMAQPDETEAGYRRLWKRFYETIAIRERTNPRCQDTNMPKRYRGTMTEFQPESYFTPKSSPAAPSAPSFPAGTPAPGIPLRSGPSAPGSAP